MSRFEIFLYEDVGPSGMTAKRFETELKALRAKAGDTIFLRINSGGGSVFDGIAIFNALRRHPAKIVVSIDGLAASAASLIAMGGNRVEISGSGYIMIHNPWLGGLSGSATEFRKAAEDLDRLAQTFREAYVSRSRGKLTDEKCKELMDLETWLTADQAVAFGLADVITEPLDMAACVKLSKFGYANAPNFAESAEPGSLRSRMRRMELIVARNEAQQRAAKAASELRDELRRERMQRMEETVNQMFLDARMFPDGSLLPEGQSWGVYSDEEHRAFIKQMFADRR